jgi:hypothetical protein
LGEERELKRLALIMMCLLVIPIVSVLVPKGQSAENVPEGIKKSFESPFSGLTNYSQQNDSDAASGKSPQTIALSGACRRDSTLMPVVDSSNSKGSHEATSSDLVVTPLGMDGLYIGYARTDDYANYPNEQFDFGSTIGITIDVDNSQASTRYVDIFVYLRTPNQDIVDGDSVYNIAVTGTGDSDAQYLTMYNGYDYLQYVGTKWHILITVRDHYTYTSFDQKAFITIGPILKDHFTCKDPYNPYGTQTTTFYDTDAQACEYTVWDTHNLHMVWGVQSDFYGPMGFYKRVDKKSNGDPLETGVGDPAWWIATWIYINGNTPQNNPGGWYVDVLLDTKFRARDGFDIMATTLPALDVNLVSPADGSTLQISPVELKARVTSGGSSVQGALVRFYVDGGEVGSANSDSSGYSSINYYPSTGTHNWYTKAEKSGYTEDTSPTWSFTYSLPPQPDFSIQADPHTLSIQVGSSGTTTIYVDSLNNFDADVSLSISNPPSGVSPSFSINPVRPPKNGRGSSVLTLTVGVTATPGTYYPRIKGTCTSPSLSHEYEIELTVGSPPQYAISLKSRTTDGFQDIGKISFAGTAYPLPGSVNKVSGKYGILALLPGSYSFHHWECTGSVSVSESEKYSNPAQAEVTGVGELKAVYFLDIQLVFSTSEKYYPVKGLFFDDNDITNNKAKYSSSYALPDVDGDNEPDVPAYYYKTNDGSYSVIEYWIYYAYDNKYLLDQEWLKDLQHEHDFEFLYLWLDSESRIAKMSLNQHYWANNYESVPTGTIYLGVEEGGHGMLLLQQTGTGQFAKVKPSNSATMPSFSGRFYEDSRSKKALLCPWKGYTGSSVEGFGDSSLLMKARYDLGLFSDTAHLDFDILFPMLSIDWLPIAENLYESATTPILLKSSEPLGTTVPICIQLTAFKALYFKFYLRAPWVREIFNDPAKQWKRLDFFWANAKRAANAILNYASLGIKNLLLKIVLAGVKFAVIKVPDIIGIINDPMNLTIVDTENHTLGYQDGTLINQLPGGLILFASENCELYLVFNNGTDLTYTIDSSSSGNYNFTISGTYFNETDPEVNFTAINIPFFDDSQHVYYLDWEVLLNNGNGTKAEIDQNGDGVFEQTLFVGDTLKAEQIGLGLAYTNKLEYVIGETATVGFENAGSLTITLANNAPWTILNESMVVIYEPIVEWIPIGVEPGEKKEWQWNQQDNYGQQVPPGTCYFQIETSAGYFTCALLILDITSPDTNITSGPTGIINYDDVSFNWTGSDNSSPVSKLTYSYYLIGYDSNWSAWTSSTYKGYNDLPRGNFTFEVKARDEAGNVDPSPAERSFMVSIVQISFTTYGLPNGVAVNLTVNNVTHAGIAPYTYLELFEYGSNVSFSASIRISGSLGVEYLLGGWKDESSNMVTSPINATASHTYYAQYQTRYVGDLMVTARNTTFAPLPNVTIYLDGYYKGLTNASGVLVIQNVPTEWHSVTGVRDDYSNASSGVYVSKGVSTPVYLTMRVKTYNVAVIVSELNGSAISSAFVYLNGSLKGATDRNGYLTIINVLLGNHVLTVRKTGYLDYSTPMTIPSSLTINVTLSKPPILTVYAKDSSTGNPIPYANVYLNGTLKGVTDYYKGNCTIGNTLPGNYELAVSKTDYWGNSTIINVTSNLTVNITLTKMPSVGTIVITVEDASNRYIPIQGVEIYLNGTYANSTDINGKLSIQNVPTGLYRVTAAKTGYDNASSSTVVYKGGTASVHLIMKVKTYFVIVNVKDSGGSAVATANVFLSGTFKGATISNGTKAISSVFPGNYTLGVNKTGYADYVAEINVTQDITINVTLTKAYILTIYVKDSSTGNTLSYTDVFIDGAYVGTTDYFGKLVIYGVAEGSHTLTVKKTGYLDYSAPINVTSSTTLTIPLIKA